MERFRHFLLSASLAVLFLITADVPMASAGEEDWERWLIQEMQPLPDWIRVERGHPKGDRLPRRFSWHRYQSYDAPSVDLTSPNKRQGSCGSCWAMATVAAIESMYKIRQFKEGGTDGLIDQEGIPLWVSLSQQELISCVDRGGSTGTCLGGFPEDALRYVADHGIHTYKVWPYSAEFFPCDYGDDEVCTCPDGDSCPIYSCTQPSSGVNSPGFYIQNNSVEAIEAGPGGQNWKEYIYNYGPLIVNIGVSSDFSNYDVDDGARVFSTDCIHPGITDTGAATCGCDGVAPPNTTVAEHCFPRSACSNSIISSEAFPQAGDSAVFRGWHAVVLVGWNDDLEAWVVRNSWRAQQAANSPIDGDAYANEWNYASMFLLDYDSACIGWRGGSTDFDKAVADRFVFVFPDDDADGDGILDIVDNCPLVSNSSQENSDLDFDFAYKMGDVCDPCTDSDGDGYKDSGTWGSQCSHGTLVDKCPGVPDLDQIDSDHDGRPDLCDPCPYDSNLSHGSSSTCDNDGDGVINGSDNCISIYNPGQVDRDHDSRGDSCDKCPDDSQVGHQSPASCDDDGDGVSNLTDNCPLPGQANEDQLDQDQDGIGDLCDKDIDGDGTLNEEDCAPLDPDLGRHTFEVCNGLDDNCDGLVDEGFKDTDFDGVMDCVDTDMDGDGLLDDSEDNCPRSSNPLQEDVDLDGIGDACDGCINDPEPANQECDDDGDGIRNLDDNCPGPDLDQANPGQEDRDEDGVGDLCDPCPDDPNSSHLDPVTCSDDADNDGVVDWEDNCPGLSNPSQDDVDGDGKGDQCDLCPYDPDPSIASPDLCVGTRIYPEPDVASVDVQGSGNQSGAKDQLGTGGCSAGLNSRPRFPFWIPLIVLCYFLQTRAQRKVQRRLP